MACFAVSAQAVEITDGDFSSFTFGATRTATVVRESTGGNPGATLNVTTVSGPTAFGTAIKTDFTTFANLSGAAFTLELDVLSGPGSFGQGQAIELLVEQNGSVYGNRLGITGYPLNFDTVSFNGTFDAVSFTRLIGAGPEHPDFNGGIATRFGFAAGNSRSGTLTQYYDNFSLESSAFNAAPVADAGPDQTIDCDGPDGTLVALDGRGSSDPDGDTLIYEWSVPAGVELNDPTSATPTGLFPIGITTATLTVTDGNGGLDVDDVEISVIDGTPPEVVCTTNIAALWPPDHSMRAVEIYIDATDHCSAPGELLLGAVTIRSNEPDDAEGNGDGDTIGDTDGEDGYTDSVDVTSSLTFNPETASFEGTVYLRAERHGDSYGRTYSINALVLDSANNLAESSCVVIIPHDRRKKK